MTLNDTKKIVSVGPFTNRIRIFNLKKPKFITQNVWIGGNTRGDVWIRGVTR